MWERRVSIHHKTRVQTDACGNHWVQTVPTLPTATHRGPQHVSPCLARFLATLPSSRKAKQELTSRFISHFAQESVIKNLKHTNGLAAIRRGSESDGMWLAVGFHPVLYRSLRQEFSRFQTSREVQECYEWAFNAKCPRMRIAWKTT